MSATLSRILLTSALFLTLIPSSPAQSPAQSLLKLHDALASGKREPMPLTTQLHDGTYYFHVNYPMTWDQADRFARDYGGYLPLVRATADARWLTEQLLEKSAPATTWLGLTSPSPGIWQLLDAALWPLESLPKGTGPCALLAANGTLTAASIDQKSPFFIAWRADGTNPLSLASIFDHTRRNLATGRPLYPRGTLQHADRHYFVANRQTTRAEAVDLAERAGARLATLASEDESAFLEEALATAPADQTYWLGATRHDLRWQWDTGPPWTHARWADDAPSGKHTTLAVVPRQGWIDAPPDQKAAGFVIEWSTETPNPPAPVESNQALADRARELLVDIEKERQLALKENAESLAWHLDTWITGHKKSYIQRWRPAINRFKARVKSHRIPTDIPRRPDRNFTEAMIKIIADLIRKQTSIDKAHQLKAERIRDAYVERLMPKRDAEFALGQLDLVRPLDRQIAAAADLKSWISTMTTR